ncbi:MAG: beta strand repeat-containing protein [Planctomycetota bacterium]
MDLSQTLEDLTSTGNNGNVKLQSIAGDIVINPGTPGSIGIRANGSGDVLLQTGNSGSILINADVVSDSGDITINSRGSLTIEDRLKTSRPGTIALISEGRITVTALTTNSDLSIASSSDVVLGTISAQGASVFVSAATSISDNDGNNNTLNINADSLQLRAGTRIGNSDTGQSNGNLNRQAITTQVNTLAARAATGIYVQERDAVTIDNVSNTVNRVNFNSTNLANTRTLEDLTTTNNGPVKLQSLAGNIIVNAGTAGSNGITANGSGDILLQTLNSGTVITNAQVQSTTGNITINSKDALNVVDRLRTTSPGAIYLRSDGNINVDSLNTNTNLQILSGGTLTLGSIDAGSSRVYLQATNDIKDADPLGNSVNVTASALAMRAGGKIGNSDTAATANTNRNAIGTRVATLAAVSGTGIYIQEADGVTIDSVNVSVDRVNFNSTRTTQTQTLEDLSTTSNGPVKLQSLTGNIIVNAGSAGSSGISANGTGDILLQALAGNVATNATIASGTGNITLDASGALAANAAIQTAGSVYLASGTNTSIQSISTSGGNVQILSGGDLTLGSINAGSGRVYLQATNDINDADPLGNSTNVTASALAMRAGGKIGNSDTTAPANTNRNAIGTRVASLAAVSATGIYIQEADGVTIDAVNVSVDRVNFTSTRTPLSQGLEDLTTTNNGPVKLQSLTGDIVVNQGTLGSNGITANGTGDILLQTLAGSITSNATIASGTGDITLDATGAITANAAIQTGGSGVVYLASGTNTSIQSISTSGGNLQILSGGDLTLGSINAGSGRVYLQAARNVIDADPLSSTTNVTAQALAMLAGKKIGDSDLVSSADTNRHAIATKVDLLAARSSNGIYVQETDGLTVDSVFVAGSKVNFNSSKSDESQVLEDLTTTIEGPIKLQSLTGNIQINPGAAGPFGVVAAVSGDILLQTLNSGTVILNGVVASELGDITINSKDALVIGDKIQTGGPPKLATIYLRSDQNVAIEALTTNDSSLWVESGASIVLGKIQAGTAGVYLDAKEDIVNGSIVPAINVATRSILAMKAGGQIGPIVTQVDFVAAVAADGITISEIDGVTIGTGSVSVDQVHFNSSKTQRDATLEDLTTTNGGSIALESLAGDIVVEPGQTPGIGISANGSGQIVLLTTNSGNIIVRGDVLSGSGNISLSAADNVLLGAQVATAGDMVLESIRGAITESSERARVQADDLRLKSGSFAHLHDTTVNTLRARTLTNAVLSSWQELNLGASDQGDDFIDALGTVSESTKNTLRAQYLFAERYQDIGYSLYVVNSKALTIDSVIAGSFTSGPLQSDKPGIYVETKAGDLLVKDEVISKSASSQAGGVVLVSGAKVLLGPSATLQSNYIRNGVLQVQLINDIDLKARIFDALEKPNPAGGFFTTRIVSRNAFSESMLPENPVSPGPTKRILQGVSTHYGSTNESGFNLYIGYADEKLEEFDLQGDIYQRDNNNQGPIEARPQATGSVGYLERSNPFDGNFLNSTQELLTDVVIRRSDDFFIFQKDQPVGFDNFNPPNGPANTSTGFYDLTVQTHRVPDVISEGSDSGLPMPPAPDVEVPIFRQPEPYVVVPSVVIVTESPEYEEPPVVERKTRIVISRIKVEILEEGEDIARTGLVELESISRDETKVVDIELPAGLFADGGQLEGTEIERIRKYLDLQPNTKQGQYIIIVETSDGSRQVLGTFIIGKEKLPDATPNSNKPPESEQPIDPDELPSGEDSKEENAGKPSNSNDQSLYLHPQTPKTSVTLESSLDKASDNAWGLMLGSLWLVRKTKELSQPESNSMTDYTIHARRIRRLSSPENTQDQFVPDDTARE